MHACPCFPLTSFFFFFLRMILTTNKPSLPNAPFFLASNLGSRNPGIQMRWERKWKFCVCAWERERKECLCVRVCACLHVCMNWISNVTKTKKGKQTKKGKGEISNISNGTEEKRSKKSKGSSVQYASFIYLIYGYGPLFHIFLLSSMQSFNVQSSSLLMEWWNNNYFFLLSLFTLSFFVLVPPLSIVIKIYPSGNLDGITPHVIMFCAFNVHVHVHVHIQGHMKGKWLLTRSVNMLCWHTTFGSNIIYFDSWLGSSKRWFLDHPTSIHISWCMSSK